MTGNQSNNLEIMIKQLELQRHNGKSPYVKDAFLRLSVAGYDENAIFGMCMWVLGSEYFRVLVLKQAWDMERYGQGLNRLPVMPWENDESDYKVDLTQEDVQDAIFDNPNLLIETTDQTKERYLHLRSRSKEIQKTLTLLIDREIFLVKAKSLGISDGISVINDSKDVFPVIIDHCIYGNLKNRRKLLKTYRNKYAKFIDPVCKEILDAMSNARYEVLLCQGILPGLGVQMKNLITGEVIRLIDINMTKTLKSGFVICAYIIAPYGVYMTTGSPLMVPDDTALIEISKIIDELITINQSNPSSKKDVDCKIAERFISTLLRYNALEHIKYV